MTRTTSYEATSTSTVSTIIASTRTKTICPHLTRSPTCRALASESAVWSTAGALATWPTIDTTVVKTRNRTSASPSKGKLEHLSFVYSFIHSIMTVGRQKTVALVVCIASGWRYMVQFMANVKWEAVTELFDFRVPGAVWWSLPTGRTDFGVNSNSTD